MCFGESFEHRRHEEQIDEIRIELRRALASDLHRGRLGAAGAAIVASIGDHVEGVHHRDDSRGEGYAAAAQSARISAAIPSLMVRHDATTEIRIERLERREDVGPANRMRRDRAPLGGIERRAVMYDIE